jgi:hypothetical protein
MKSELEEQYTENSMIPPLCVGDGVHADPDTGTCDSRHVACWGEGVYTTPDGVCASLLACGPGTYMTAGNRCVPHQVGCRDVTAMNYRPEYTQGDDAQACIYDPEYDKYDGTCGDNAVRLTRFFKPADLGLPPSGIPRETMHAVAATECRRICAGFDWCLGVEVQTANAGEKCSLIPRADQIFTDASPAYFKNIAREGDEVKIPRPGDTSLQDEYSLYGWGALKARYERGDTIDDVHGQTTPAPNASCFWRHLQGE